MRLSWTKCNTWDKWSRENAIRMMKRLPTKSSYSAERGKRMHEVMELERFNPLGLTGSPQKWEYKTNVKLYDWLSFTIVIDLWIGNVVADFKTGKVGKADPMQLYIYALCMYLEGYEINEGHILYVDSNENDGIYVVKDVKYEIGMDELREAWEYLDDMAWQIRGCLEQDGDERSLVALNEY